MFADDTVICIAASDANHLLQVLNDEVKFLLDWSNKNDLFIHPKRTEFVNFGTSMKLYQFDSVNLSEVNLGGQVINRVPFYEYLGIYLDQSLSFGEHVSELNNKISSQLGLLSWVRNN